MGYVVTKHKEPLSGFTGFIILSVQSLVDAV